jgi:hypothetical protein
MNEIDFQELIFYPHKLGDMAQFLDPSHKSFDVENSLLLAKIQPSLFTEQQILFLQNMKSLNRSFQEQQEF